MKTKILYIIAFILIPFFTHAQGVITVFSEEGDKFYLVLNGVKQNPVPQTNVRVDGLTNDFYNSKIIFDDPSKPEITKNLNTKDAATGQYAEVTFKIKKTKDGDMKLRYFGATPVPLNYNPPPDMYVAHYDQPATTVTQTTITTTTSPSNDNMNTGAGNVNMSINMQDPSSGNGGVSINMNVPDMNSNSTQTTTTRSTTTTTTMNNGSYNNTTQAASVACQVPMDYSSFSAAKSTISKASFEDTKLSTAKSILSSNCVSSDQVVQICNLFSFEESKLNFAKFAYSKTTDQGNYFKVGNVFTFDANKNDLNTWILHR